MLVATTNDLPGHRITETLGVIRGITVRSRSVLGNIGGSIQSLFGGNLSIYTKLAETARQEAYELMVEHAQVAGANAIVGMRYDANEIMDGITEVLAYGTAVRAVPDSGQPDRRRPEFHESEPPQPDPRGFGRREV